MENQKEKKVFRSRISVLLIGFILALLTPSILPKIKQILFSGSFTLVTISGTFAFLFIISLFIGFRYIISGDKLHGKILWIIPSGSIKISDIVSVERSYNPLSSCAGSLKRLALNNREKSFPYILISPVREQEFIEELKLVNPNIKVRVPVKKGIWRIWDWDI
jgi:hypothetical protein